MIWWFSGMVVYPHMHPVGPKLEAHSVLFCFFPPPPCILWFHFSFVSLYSFSLFLIFCLSPLFFLLISSS